MTRLDALSIPVQSSLLASVSCQPEESVLDLEFRAGGIVYRYFHVPRDIYTRLLKAESRGAYFNHQIRNRFLCQRLQRER